MNRLLILMCFLVLVTSSPRDKGLTAVICSTTYAYCVNQCSFMEKGYFGPCRRNCKKEFRSCMALVRQKSRRH
ncbi:hypothetical protein ScPMuIL_001344 [Solemya velum]